MTIALLASWAPCGLVRMEHSAFLADIAASLVGNGIEVVFSCTTESDHDNAYDDIRSDAVRRQADFFFRLAWNVWGPLGPVGKEAYTLAIQAIVAATTPSQLPLPLVESIHERLGEVDCIVFDTPVDEEFSACDHVWTVPLARVELNMVMTRCPMIMARSLTRPRTTNVIGAKVPASLFDPATGRIFTVNPQYA
jgi:hypothetical protein